MTVSARTLDRLEERVGELLASRESARRDFSDYRDEPVRFMREVLGFVPWSKQVEVAQAVLDGKRTVVRGHHGAGKDFVLAALLLWATYARGMLSIVISATERQVLGQVWAELARMWQDAGCFAGELFVGELRIDGRKRIVAMTSGSVSNLTGWHNHSGGGVFVAISESQAEQVGNAAFDAAEGNCAGEGSRIAVVGNPVRASGRFYEVSRKPTWQAVRISAFDHPNVKEGRVVIPGGPAPSWPEEMAREYGTESAFYVSRVLGEFPSEGSIDALLRRDLIEDAFERHSKLPKLHHTRHVRVTAALDVARSLERDESVAAIAVGRILRPLHSWRVRDLVATSDRFLRVVDPVQDRAVSIGGKRVRLVVDASGVGGGVVDLLRARGERVEEWWGWNPAREERRFANRRAESFWSLRRALEEGELALPRDERLLEDLLAQEWSQDAKGRVLLLDKESLRKQLGRSPDRADAAVMALSEELVPRFQAGMISFRV